MPIRFYAKDVAQARLCRFSPCKRETPSKTVAQTLPTNLMRDRWFKRTCATGRFRLHKFTVSGARDRPQGGFPLVSVAMGPAGPPNSMKTRGAGDRCGADTLVCVGLPPRPLPVGFRRFSGALQIRHFATFIICCAPQAHSYSSRRFFACRPHPLPTHLIPDSRDVLRES